MGALVKKLSSGVLLGLLLTLLFVPGNVLAYNFDFSGTVLHDSKSIGSAYGDSFEGSLVLSDDFLTFMNTNASSFFEAFGSVTGDYFNQDGQDFFYAFSQGQDASSQMGIVWWSDPRSFRVGQDFFQDVYGLAFYMEGNILYTPSQMIAYRLADYFATGYFPTVTGGGSTLHFYSNTSCGTCCSTAFLGIIETPFIAAQPSTVIPLPASVWFLGSGLLFLIRRRKR